MKIVEVQQALASRGYRPGPLDGVWGRQTIAALKAFQADNGLDPDGVLGPRTLGVLAPDSASGKTAKGFGNPSLVWFKEALRLMGVREVTGPDNNGVILDWAKGQGIPYKGDDIPWCGLFVGHCISSTLEREPVPGNVLGARSWGRFGIATKPTMGAVMVFWRKSPSSGLGHVGFYAGEDPDAYRVVGGNQGDCVCTTWIGKDRLVGARWPATVPPPIPEVVIAKRTEKLSWNEA